MSYFTMPADTRSHAAEDIARATSTLVARERHGANAALALNKARWSAGNIPPQPPFTSADAGALTSGPPTGPILIRTIDAFPERVLAPLAPVWHEPAAYSEMAKSLRNVIDFQTLMRPGTIQLNVQETGAQRTDAERATRFPREAWYGGAPTALYGLGALAGKKGKAIAAANQTLAKQRLALLHAVGRDFRVGSIATADVMAAPYWPGTNEEFALLEIEANKVKSRYIPWLVEEAKLYGIAPGEDPSTFTVDKLVEFYDAVVTYRKALLADAAQYSLGPNANLPEPKRWLDLATEVMVARKRTQGAGAEAASNGYAPPRAGAVSAPLRYEPPPQEPPSSKFLWIGLGLATAGVVLFTARRLAKRQG